MLGSTGKGDGQFAEVAHMATDSFDNIYVNDPQLGADGSGMPRVQKFDTNGHFIKNSVLADQMMDNL